MSASEQFIQAIQTGDLVYVEKHLKRPVRSTSVVQNCKTQGRMNAAKFSRRSLQFASVC